MSLKQPVRYPVKYYSYADTDAPQMADADGVIKTILKACLVTGYGNGADAKAGAGWEMLFDDANRLIVRTPDSVLHGYPAIKIENGVINGTARHRIVSQNNPSGLNDPSELASVNLLARDSYFRVEWHCVVSDFGFVLCYQMGYSSASNARNNILYVGDTKKWMDNDSGYFVATHYPNVDTKGKGTTGLYALLDESNRMRDMRTGTDYPTTTAVAKITGGVREKHYNNDYLAQPLTIGYLFDLPFFCSMIFLDEGSESSVISLDSRPMLRYYNNLVYTQGSRPMYIPIDYWEL